MFIAEIKNIIRDMGSVFGVTSETRIATYAEKTAQYTPPIVFRVCEA